MYLSDTDKMISISGKGNRRGSFMGKTVFIEKLWQGQKEDDQGDVDSELARFLLAKEQAKNELSALRREISKEAGEMSWIFLSQLSLLDDTVFDELPRLYINEGKSATEAIKLSLEYFFEVLCTSHSAHFLRSLAADVLDVAERLCGIIINAQRENYYNELLDASSHVLVCPAPSPSLIADIRHKAVGIIASLDFLGTNGADLADFLNIPYICTENISDVPDKKSAILDSDKGTLFINPDFRTLTDFSERKEIRKSKSNPNPERHNKNMLFLANKCSVFDAFNISPLVCDGIAQLTSESLFLEEGGCPDEDILFEHYRRVAELMPEKPVILRSFKSFNSVHIFENENLSGGASELYVMHSETIKRQLRAAMRASVYGKLLFLMPPNPHHSVIVRLSEECKKELREEKREFSELLLGTRISSATEAIMCDELLLSSDFAVIEKSSLEKSLAVPDDLGGVWKSLKADALCYLLNLISTSCIKHKKFSVLCLGDSATKKDLLQASELSFSAVALPYRKIAELR